MKSKYFKILLTLTFVFVLNFNISNSNTLFNLQEEEIVFTPENDKTLKITENETNRFNCGLKVGIATGSGVSLGIDRIAEKWSADITVLPFKIDETSLYIFGTSVKYSLQDLGKYNLYLNAGLSYNYYSKDGSDNRRVDPFRVGVGFGYMQFFSQNFAYDLQILGTYFANSGDFYPIPQLTIQYHFK